MTDFSDEYQDFDGEERDDQDIGDQDFDDDIEELQIIFEEQLFSDCYLRDVAGSNDLELVRYIERKDGEIKREIFPDFVSEYSSRIQAVRLKDGYEAKDFIGILEECIIESHFQSKSARKDAIKYSLAKVAFFGAKFVAFPFWNYFSRKESESRANSASSMTLSKFFKLEIAAFKDAIYDIEESIL